jgi:hypothetical protein
VAAPVLKFHKTRFDLMPYSVLVDPILASDLVVRKGTSGFPGEVAYIFRKQLEEADLICVNKIDQITEEKLARLVGEIWKAFPQSAVFPISAVTGEGFSAWLTALSSFPSKVRVAEVDYDEYAKGEACLGWLNLSADIESKVSRLPNAYLLTLVNDLARRLDSTGARIAHIKVMVSDGASFALAHRTATNPFAILSESSSKPMTSGKLLINARVVLDPQVLEQQVLASLTASFGDETALSNTKCSSFRPSRPVPMHRLPGV